MSYSASFIGTPENIIKALQAESERLTGQSKIEFDNVLPNIVSLIGQNFSAENPVTPLKVNVSGHVYTSNGKPIYGTCFFSMETVPAILV